jgi:hypothetical protein
MIRQPEASADALQLVLRPGGAIAAHTSRVLPNREYCPGQGIRAPARFRPGGSRRTARAPRMSRSSSRECPAERHSQRSNWLWRPRTANRLASPSDINSRPTRNGGKAQQHRCPIRSYRRRGIAKALHDALLVDANEERATLLVRPEAVPARTAYERWGYARVGAIRPWPGAPLYDAMVLNLRRLG